MNNYEGYRIEIARAEPYYQSNINDRQNKAFEYGLLVFKNSILISGGGLLSIPTILALNETFPLDIPTAGMSGVFFSASLITALLASYISHLNWNFNVSAWGEVWESHKKILDDLYIKGMQADDVMVESARSNKWIGLTFWIPNFLAFVYLAFLTRGFYLLYAAFSIFEK